MGFWSNDLFTHDAKHCSCRYCTLPVHLHTEYSSFIPSGSSSCKHIRHYFAYSTSTSGLRLTIVYTELPINEDSLNNIVVLFIFSYLSYFGLNGFGLLWIIEFCLFLDSLFFLNEFIFLNLLFEVNLIINFVFAYFYLLI